MPPLSKRLKAIAALVPHGARVCDIGTDHGYLSIYLKQSGIAETVIATDIRPSPLENARKNIAKSGIEGIETRLCSGLSAIKPDEADTVIIAGMGGEVISNILCDCEWLKLTPCPLLILQPTTSPEVLRRCLYDNGFKISAETAISDKGKLYTVITAHYTGKKYSPMASFYYIGKTNPMCADGLLYIKKQYARLKKCADALEKTPEKQREYLYYSKLCNEISGIIKTASENTYGF